MWHINKNVQTKAQKTWRDADSVTKVEKEEITEKRAKFMKRWTQVCSAPIASYKSFTELTGAACLRKETTGVPIKVGRTT